MVLTIVIVFLTSVGSLLISALMVGLGIVCAHSAFRVPEDLFLDEQEPTVGFLSFLGGGGSQSPVVGHTGHYIAKESRAKTLDYFSIISRTLEDCIVRCLEFE
jgi:hypothetical protein